ncbi:hypothetical protein D3C78_1798540 [compost metagenome]
MDHLQSLGDADLMGEDERLAGEGGVGLIIEDHGASQVLKGNYPVPRRCIALKERKALCFSAPFASLFHP